MNFLSNIPYKLSSTYEENNIDLKLRKKCSDKVSFFSSYRYCEVYLFGNVFESLCYLWFSDGILDTIEYRFHKRYFELFKDSINDELPLGKKLLKDPFVKGLTLWVSVNSVAISLIELTEDFFLLKISKHPSLPRIKI